MENKLSKAIRKAPRKILIETVKLAQRKEISGSQGNWKEFLVRHREGPGTSACDPAKRSNETLLSFIETFIEKKHRKFVEKVLQLQSNSEMLECILHELTEASHEMKLVQLTHMHPMYLSSFSFPSYNEDWVITKLRHQNLNTSEMLAVDCEMVPCMDGSNALVKICVVDRNLEVVLDKLVKPSFPVVDYISHITGVTAEDLHDVTCSLLDIQKIMKKLLSKGKILVGHALYNDLNALKLDHMKVIDTSFIFGASDGRSLSLNNLCKCVLGFELRKDGEPHNCLEDARSAMKLVLAKLARDSDNDAFPTQEIVDCERGTGVAQLLLHRIPVSVPSEELHNALSGDFSIELKKSRKAQWKHYSAHAIFKTLEEAHEAFEAAKGTLEKDSGGKPQKVIKFKLRTGGTGSLCVREMGVRVIPDKKPAENTFQDEGSEESGKRKREESVVRSEEMEMLKEELRQKEEIVNEQVREIEKLRQELSCKSFQVVAQDKIIAQLSKRAKKC